MQIPFRQVQILRLLQVHEVRTTRTGTRRRTRQLPILHLFTRYVFSPELPRRPFRHFLGPSLDSSIQEVFLRGMPLRHLRDDVHYYL